MGLNKGKFINKSKIYAAIFILLVSIIIDATTVHYLELNKRQQARFNLEHSLSCFYDVETDYNKSLGFNGIKHCVNKMRTSISGDMYVLDRNTLDFIYDGSSDIPKDLQFTEDSVGQYFKEWDTAEDALKYLLSGTNSTPTTFAKYNFDGAEEWLEYVTYTTLENTELVLVQGIQSDEVKISYQVPRTLAAFLVSIYIFWLLSTSLHNRRK